MELILINEEYHNYIKLAQVGKQATIEEIEHYCRNTSSGHAFKAWVLKVNDHTFDDLDEKIIHLCYRNNRHFKDLIMREDIKGIQRYIDIYGYLIDYIDEDESKDAQTYIDRYKKDQVEKTKSQEDIYKSHQDDNVNIIFLGCFMIGIMIIGFFVPVKL